MSRKLVRDLFEEVNIYELMGRELPIEPLMDYDVLKSLTVAEGGNRELTSFVKDVDPELLARMLVLRFGERWTTIIENTPMEGFGGRKLIETIKDDEVRSNTNSNINKVSAFDSDELINDGGSELSGEDKLTGTKVRELREENSSINSQIKYLTFSEKYGIIRVVLSDVVEYISLSIY